MPNAEYTYRRALAADLTAICLLGQMVNLLHHEAWPTIFAPPADLSRDEAHLRQGIEGEGCATFVAETQDEVVGFVAVAVTMEKNPLCQPICYARINSVCVVPTERGKGIGRNLMVLAEEWAAESGAVEMRLSVWQFNVPAIRLYEELGYETRSFSMGKSLIHSSL